MKKHGRQWQISTDIDECAESDIVCGINQKCFNKRGDYECVDITCPPNYERDAQSGYGAIFMLCSHNK